LYLFNWIFEQIYNSLIVKAILINTINIIEIKLIIILFLKKDSTIKYIKYVNNKLCKINNNKIIVNLILILL